MTSRRWYRWYLRHHGDVSGRSKFFCKRGINPKSGGETKLLEIFISEHRDITLGFLDLQASSDVMGCLQGVQMDLTKWVNSRNGHRWRWLCDNCSPYYRNQCHYYLEIILSKNKWKWKDLDQEGAYIPITPVDPPLDVVVKAEQLHLTNCVRAVSLKQVTKTTKETIHIISL